MNSMQEKFCNSCQEVKPLTAFAVQKTHRVGSPVPVCTPCRVEWNRNRRKENPEHVADIERRSKFKRQYGITLEDYNRMLDKQDGGCGICSSKVAGNRTKYFAVDHCHTTQKVRGLLCTKCNRGLGLFNDNTERLLNAVNYLKEF